MSELLWYAALFVLAATPFIELLVVIPLGGALGLPILPVTVIAFIGNAIPVFGIIALYRWWVARRGPIQRRWSARALRVWDRYGLPGVALTGPVLTGIHLAAVMALAMGSPQRRVWVWMTASLAVWALGTALLTALGVEWLKP